MQARKPHICQLPVGLHHLHAHGGRGGGGASREGGRGKRPVVR
jgi:hypothetical protein